MIHVCDLHTVRQLHGKVEHSLYCELAEDIPHLINERAIYGVYCEYFGDNHVIAAPHWTTSVDALALGVMITSPCMVLCSRKESINIICCQINFNQTKLTVLFRQFHSCNFLTWAALAPSGGKKLFTRTLRASELSGDVPWFATGVLVVAGCCALLTGWRGSDNRALTASRWSRRAVNADMCSSRRWFSCRNWWRQFNREATGKTTKSSIFNSNSLTRGLVMQYGKTDLDQHWFR